MKYTKVDYTEPKKSMHHHLSDGAVLILLFSCLIVGILIGWGLTENKYKEERSISWEIINAGLTDKERFILDTNNKLYFRRKCYYCGRKY